MEPDFYWEVDTMAVCRYFDIRLDEKSGRWIAEILPEMLDGFKPQILPPGQEVQIGDEGLVSGPSEPINEGWACRPWFKTRESAWQMAQEWIKRERPDLYDECKNEVREARKWRDAQKKS